MNEPKIVLKESNKVVCTVACILLPIMLVALIYEIRALTQRRHCKVEGTCPELECESVEN